jgi:hypothetical protein
MNSNEKLESMLHEFQWAMHGEYEKLLHDVLESGAEPRIIVRAILHINRLMCNSVNAANKVRHDLLS